jgi:transcriptional regulator with XRE-family HTH domain
VNAKRVTRAPGAPSPHDEPSELRRTFARNLRRAREAVGLSQHALATAASCDPRLLANIESGAANVKLDTITRLAKPLSLREIDLLRPDMDDVTATRVSRAPTDAPAEARSKTEPTEFRRALARNLREIRRAAGLQQKTLGNSAAMRLSTISAIEVNAKNVTLDTVTLLAKHLGCSEIDLLGPKDR